MNKVLTQNSNAKRPTPTPTPSHTPTQTPTQTPRFYYSLLPSVRNHV